MFTVTAAQSITGKVIHVIRHGHTMYGNPTMSVELKVSAVDGTPYYGMPVTVRIQDNSGLVYGIENADYREVDHVYTLTKSGRIRNAQKA